MVAFPNAIFGLDSFGTKFSSFIHSPKEYLLFISIPITVVKEDSKMEAFRKGNFTFQEYKKVTKYKKKKSRYLKGEKCPQN